MVPVVEVRMVDLKVELALPRRNLAWELCHTYTHIILYQCAKGQ